MSLSLTLTQFGGELFTLISQSFILFLRTYELIDEKRLVAMVRAHLCAHLCALTLHTLHRRTHIIVHSTHPLHLLRQRATSRHPLTRAGLVLGTLSVECGGE